MRVIIAGAGIGGLTTALSLHAAGITDVVIREAVPELRPLGVGINLLPHAVRELTELGLAERVAAIGVPLRELVYANRHGHVISAEDRGLAAGYRWPQYSVHRGALQMLLLAAVEERLGPDAVRRGDLVSGPEHDGDILVAADGIRSTVRAAFHPDEGEPIWNGLTLWRGVTRAEPFRTGASMVMAGDGANKFVAYPIGPPGPDGLAPINWIAERPTGEGSAKGDWNREVPAASVAADFADWDLGWLNAPALIAGADKVFEYPMVDRDPLPRWTHGTVTLLGDAAHPMYPIGSNGASQAVLDARVLARALATSPTVEQGLAAYEAERRPATSGIVRANRGMGPELVLKLAHERAPEGFDDIEKVIPEAERAEIALRYKQVAGFAPADLNERESWSVGPTGTPPNLVPLATFHVTVDPILHLGRTPLGDRRVINITGGSFHGPGLNGEILPGGADWQLVRDDGSAAIDTRYTLRTYDGALLYLQTRGYRHGPPDVMARLAAGEDVPPSDYYFRLTLTFETAHPSYSWLTRTIALATAHRTPTAVTYNAYTLP
ncbi:DUF3237 family protein [Actinocorallia sp. A-T 12471]|uniref:DUF3237 family protein n=1 Tax=Actinocorallia sp. A-T 12471 TaxID=3089813 RepID=UPI0029CF0311|nr:DUF3237 family protein [Actinocorallia sp. A-T 12471]MDX6741263.1 DUF3237 family protein [Actinocorallia sp. A-T 12471]